MTSSFNLSTSTNQSGWGGYGSTVGHENDREKLANRFVIFNWLNQYITSWYLPLLVILGVTGYAVCLLVVVKRQSFSRDVQNWIVAMCLTFIYVLLLSGLLDYYVMAMSGVYLPGLNRYVCHILLTANNMGFFMTAWVQTGTSVLRAYATISPLRSKVVVTRFRSNCALCIVCSACLLLAIVNGTHFVSYDQEIAAESIKKRHWNDSYAQLNSTLKNNLTENTTTPLMYYQCNVKESLIYVEFVARDVLPFIIMTISSGVVILGLRRASKYGKRRSLRQRRTTVMLLGERHLLSRVNKIAQKSNVT